jgi:hypothetical protein
VRRSLLSFVDYLVMLDYTAPDGGMASEWLISRNSRPNRDNIPEFASRDWERPRKNLSRCRLSRPRVEPSTSQIHCRYANLLSAILLVHRNTTDCYNCFGYLRNANNLLRLCTVMRCVDSVGTDWRGSGPHMFKAMKNPTKSQL